MSLIKSLINKYNTSCHISLFAFILGYCDTWGVNSVVLEQEASVHLSPLSHFEWVCLREFISYEELLRQSVK